MTTTTTTTTATATATTRTPARLGTVGLVARFKPVHLAHAAMLATLAARADRLKVGIGSVNKHDLRNPFTARETAEMVDLVLAGTGARYERIEIPDLDDGPRWRLLAREAFGPVDLFVTANEYVQELLADFYPIVHPRTLVPREHQVRVDGTMVRRAMARGEEWERLVPPAVARYLKERGLVERFRREFGLATVALDFAEAGR